MSHAKSLRVIGQALEAAQIATFELEKYSPQYMIWTVSVSEAGQRILRNALRHDKVTPQEVRARANHVFCFSPADILRLDAQAQKQRRNQSFFRYTAVQIALSWFAHVGRSFRPNASKRLSY
jgi:hypothetical protein